MEFRRGMPFPRRVLAGMAGAAMLPGAPRAQARRAVEVVHWWTGGSEGAAIRTIRSSLEAQGYAWRDVAVEGPDVAKAAAITRVLGGQPPTAMLWFVSPDLPELLRDGVIRDIHRVATAEGWDSVLPPEIARRLKVDGRYVAAPADLHCSNCTFSNTRLLAAAGVEVPESWPAVLHACARLRDTGVIPIAFGGQAWQETAVFVMVATGIGGASLFRRLVSEHDPAAAGSDEIVESFATFARLKPFVDRGSANRSWTDTANLVATHRAALHFVGDWARGDLNRAGLRAGVDYDCRPAPGNAGIFSAVVDAFCFPRTAEAEVAAAQDAFARTTMDPAVQHAFNLAKGSLPPRGDVALDGYDPLAMATARMSRGEGVVLPSPSMGMTTAMRAAVYDVVHRFWNTEGADPRAAARDLRIAVERNRA